MEAGEATWSVELVTIFRLSPDCVEFRGFKYNFDIKCTSIIINSLYSRARWKLRWRDKIRHKSGNSLWWTPSKIKPLVLIRLSAGIYSLSPYPFSIKTNILPSTCSPQGHVCNPSARHDFTYAAGELVLRRKTFLCDDARASLKAHCSVLELDLVTREKTFCLGLTHAKLVQRSHYFRSQRKLRLSESGACSESQELFLFKISLRCRFWKKISRGNDC